MGTHPPCLFRLPPCESMLHVTKSWAVSANLTNLHQVKLKLSAFLWPYATRPINMQACYSPAVVGPGMRMYTVAVIVVG